MRHLRHRVLWFDERGLRRREGGPRQRIQVAGKRGAPAAWITRAPRAGQRAVVQNALLFGQAFLGLRQPVQALPVRRGLGCLCLECLVHEIKLLAHTGEPLDFIGACRFFRADLRGFREAFARQVSAGAPLKACSVGFSGHFFCISGSETRHEDTISHRPAAIKLGRGLSLAEVRGRVFDACVNAKDVEL